MISIKEAAKRSLECYNKGLSKGNIIKTFKNDTGIKSRVKISIGESYHDMCGSIPEFDGGENIWYICIDQKGTKAYILNTRDFPQLPSNWEFYGEKVYSSFDNIIYVEREINNEN